MACSLEDLAEHGRIVLPEDLPPAPPCRIRRAGIRLQPAAAGVLIEVLARVDTEIQVLGLKAQERIGCGAVQGKKPHADDENHDLSPG